VGTIPTVQIKYSGVGGPATDPAGTLIAQGSVGQDSNPFSDTSFINGLPVNIVTFDVYEDGAPMADGRIFQVSHFAWSAYPVASGPTQSITRMQAQTFPFTYLDLTTSMQRINAPVRYTTIDNCWTVFYWDDSAPKAVAEVYVMRGQFKSLLIDSATAGDAPNRGIGPGMIPVFINAADLVGTDLAGYDSSAAVWTLATCQLARSGALVPYSYNSGLCPVYAGMPPVPFMTETNHSRVGMGMVGTTTLFNAGYGNPVAVPLTVNTTNGHAYSYGYSSPRCYRRGDASGTYDWPGYNTLL